MRIIYGLAVLLEAILIAHCAIGSLKKHDRLGKSVCIYETLAFACATVFFVFTFVPGQEKSLMKSIWYSYHVYPIYILGIVQNLIHCIFGAGIEISALFFYNNKPCGLL